MAQCVIPSGGDQDGGEKNISHLPVEEVQPVVRLCHESGFGMTRVLIFQALHKNQNKRACFQEGSHPASLRGYEV